MPVYGNIRWVLLARTESEQEIMYNAKLTRACRTRIAGDTPLITVLQGHSDGRDCRGCRSEPPWPQKVNSPLHSLKFCWNKFKCMIYIPCVTFKHWFSKPLLWSLGVGALNVLSLRAPLCRNIPRFNDENFKNNVELVAKLKEIAKKRGATPGQIALAWLHAQVESSFPQIHMSFVLHIVLIHRTLLPSRMCWTQSWNQPHVLPSSHQLR